MKHKVALVVEKGISKRGIIICLVAISLVTFILRTVYPFHAVFGNFVNFIETDAYYQMGVAKSIAAMPFWNSIPHMVYNSYLFPWVIALLSHIAPIEFVGAWLPPILAVATVIVVYFIGASLFNPKVGLLSAIFVAVIPSEFMHRSLLGFTDHHVLEVLTMALVILFLIKAVKKPRPLWIVLAGVSMFLYMANSKSGVYLIGILLILFAIVTLFQRENRFKTLPVIALVAAVGLVLFIPLGGYSRFLFLIPSQGDQVAAQTTGEMVQTVVASTGTRTISELMPLLYPAGTFNLGVVFSNLHLFALASLIGFPLLWLYRKERVVWIFAAWTFVLLIITLNERRFLYYLTLPIGILSALACYEIGKRLKGKPLQNAMILALPLIIISLPLDKNMADNPQGQMSQDWHNALVWLKDQPEGNVSAWGDYGHWIQYISEKPATYLPGPGGDLIAKLYLSTSDDEAKQLLNAMDTSYLIVDETTLTLHYGALVVYAGKDTIPHSAGLAGRLYYQNKIPDYLRLVYENGSLRIYKYEPRG